MLRDHSFRKANISVAIAAAVMAVGLLIFGRGASDGEVQLVTFASFAAMVVSVFVQYEIEDRRERRSARSDDRVS